MSKEPTGPRRAGRVAALPLGGSDGGGSLKAAPAGPAR